MASMPEILWCQTFKCMTLSEVSRLRLVSRKFRDFVDHFGDIFETECVRVYTSSLKLFQ